MTLIGRETGDRVSIEKIRPCVVDRCGNNKLGRKFAVNFSFASVPPLGYILFPAHVYVINFVAQKNSIHP